MPVVHPASIDEYEAFALWGWALSRHSGAWVAFKAISETVESGQAYTPAPPARYDMPADPDLPPEALERSEEHTSELQSLMRISYAVFCLKKKKNNTQDNAQ